MIRRVAQIRVGRVIGQRLRIVQDRRDPRRVEVCLQRIPATGADDVEVIYVVTVRADLRGFDVADPGQESIVL